MGCWITNDSYASVAQLVEQRIENPRVVGSIPTGGMGRIAKCVLNADLAHLVERDLAKVEVAGSSPVIRLKRVSEKVLAFCISEKYWRILLWQ